MNLYGTLSEIWRLCTPMRKLHLACNWQNKVTKGGLSSNAGEDKKGCKRYRAELPWGISAGLLLWPVPWDVRSASIEVMCCDWWLFFVTYTYSSLTLSGILKMHQYFCKPFQSFVDLISAFATLRFSPRNNYNNRIGHNVPLNTIHLKQLRNHDNPDL